MSISSSCRGGWRAGGLAASDPQQDPDHRKETDLSRLSKVHGVGFDRAFLKVMLARDGAIPELRALARQMTTELQAQIEQLTALLGA